MYCTLFPSSKFFPWGFSWQGFNEAIIMTWPVNIQGGVLWNICCHGGYPPVTNRLKPFATSCFEVAGSYSLQPLINTPSSIVYTPTFEEMKWNEKIVSSLFATLSSISFYLALSTDLSPIYWLYLITLWYLNQVNYWITTRYQHERFWFMEFDEIRSYCRCRYIYFMLLLNVESNKVTRCFSVRYLRR